MVGLSSQCPLAWWSLTRNLHGHRTRDGWLIYPGWLRRGASIRKDHSSSETHYPHHRCSLPVALRTLSQIQGIDWPCGPHGCLSKGKSALDTWASRLRGGKAPRDFVGLYRRNCQGKGNQNLRYPQIHKAPSKCQRTSLGRDNRRGCFRIFWLEA